MKKSNTIKITLLATKFARIYLLLSVFMQCEKAVGLLGNAKGVAKPIPFVEDTCVPQKILRITLVNFALY